MKTGKKRGDITQYEIKTVKTEIYEMDYLTFGHGAKSFVIIPGVSLKSVMLSAPAIAKQYEMFTQDYTCYLFDRKKNMKAGYTVSDMARDTADAIKSIGLSDIYALGVSQGGMILLTMAVNEPDLFKKIVLGSTISRKNPVALESIDTWVELGKKRDFYTLSRDMFQRVYTESYLERYKRAFEMLSKMGSEEDCENFSIQAGACYGFDVYDRLDELKCDVFVIGSDDDKAVGSAGSYEIAQKLGCKIYMYKEYGHAAYDEAPDYKDRIKEFFDE